MLPYEGLDYSQMREDDILPYDTGEFEGREHTGCSPTRCLDYSQMREDDILPYGDKI